MNKYLISPLLLTLLLQGCGGGSSSSPEAPVDPVEYTFSLTAQLTNDCGVASAFTDVELLLQDDTWQTFSTYKADESGVISFVTTSEFINYTLVAKDQQGSEAQGLNVVSFYQASSATPSHYQAQFDELLDDRNSSCECVTQDVELIHSPFTTRTQVTSSLNFESVQSVDDSHTLFEGVKVCHASDGSWPLHSFSILGTDVDQVAIGAAQFIDDFSANSEGVWSLSAIISAKNIDLDIPHPAFTTSQIIDNLKYFYAEVAKEDESLLLFKNHSNTHKAYYQSQASKSFIPESIFPNPVVNTHHQIISTIAEESFSVKANEQQPAFRTPNFDEIKPDGSYDYSAVSGYPMAEINFTFEAYDPITKLLMPAKWTFYGPEKGMLAISAPLTGYEGIIDYENIETTNVRLIKSAITNRYIDYVKHYQGDSVLDMSNDFVKNIKEAELILKF